jgi:outer membrane protein TolC
MRTPIALLLAGAALGAAAQSPPAARPPAPSSAASAHDEGAAAPAASLAELLERAWSLAGRDPVEAARGSELDARARALDSPFAGPPSVGLDLRRDLPVWVRLPGTDVSLGRGRNEIEPGVSVPVWLPGQRDAQRRVVAAERAQRSASVRAARLELAGQVREAAWAVSLARGEARVQAAREAAAVALERDVGRRVAAGDLAPVDGLTARGERLAAAVAARDAEARVADAGARLRELAGTDRVGTLREAPRDDPAPDAHPTLAKAREAVDAARARLEAARATRRDAPTVSAAARFEREVAGGAYRNSIRLGVEVPLDTEARNAPRLAAAGAELTEAEIAFERVRRALAAEVERARIALAASRATLAANVERAALAAHALAAIERAFAAGERALPELLLQRSRALDAQLDRELADERHGLAIARLNQALGVEP